MKFMIAVDLEGVGCVVGLPNTLLSESPDYEFACRQAIREVNAAANALFEMGAEQVIVWDNHSRSLNLHYEELDERCDILAGIGEKHRLPMLDETFSGLLLIGYHPMDNTFSGVLAHTFSSVDYQWMKINDVEVGEIEIDAAMAGEWGVPLIFTASDDKGTAEALSFMPWVETVATKIGLGRNLAMCKHPYRVANEIYEATKRAVDQIGQNKTFKFQAPIKLQIRFKRLEKAQDMVNGREGWEWVDPYTIIKTFNKLSDYF